MADETKNDANDEANEGPDQLDGFDDAESDHKIVIKDEASEEEIEGEDEEEIEDDDQEPKMLFGKIPLPGKTVMIIIIIVGVLTILGGGGLVLYSMGTLDSMLGIHHTDEENQVKETLVIDIGKPIYFDQPEFVADLKSDKCQGSLLKISLTFQIDEDDEDIFELRQPKIIDRIQQHLRSITKQDLSGEVGANKLRDNLTIIINNTVKPAVVQNVLFRSFVIQ